MQARTVIVIAHRLSTSARCDRVGVIIDGRPIEQMDAAYLRRVGTVLEPHARYEDLIPDITAYLPTPEDAELVFELIDL